ncbi:EamA family transporter RarD [Propioniciclava soli]|uniref:EamA family transporter RarD n=1 Tax=Propioniciclava soli TaxID=2775081 RepID=A0ABZ3C8J6_9ACTN
MTHPAAAPGGTVPAPDDGSRERSIGLASGVAAYVIWGFFPLLFPLLKPSGPMEILAHRVVWSLAAVGLVLLALRRPWGWLRDAARRDKLPWLAAASLLIGLNWLTFIWAVNSAHVVEASLGYFINPLVNIVLGVWLFGERMTRGGLTGTLLALVGVSVIAWENWRGLWVSLLLAASFGLYGVVKKRAKLGALEGLFVESGLLVPLALAYWAWLAATGASHFGSDARASALLMFAGVLTALPLWLFALAAPRLPFGVVGVLQYLGPTIQFGLGITVFGQVVGLSYWAGLVLVWAGSAVYLSSVFARARKQRVTPPV